MFIIKCLITLLISPIVLQIFYQFFLTVAFGLGGISVCFSVLKDISQGKGAAKTAFGMIDRKP